MEEKRVPLEKDTILQKKYKISELISKEGATCLVYKTHPLTEDGNEDTHNPLILKEFYPKNWSLNREGNHLRPKFHFLEESFQKEVDNFCAQTEFNNASGYNEATDSRYMTFLHMTSFKENGTGYVEISAVNGKTLDTMIKEVRDAAVRNKEGFVKLIDVMTCIADTVLIQNKAGFLNLDLKPDNILVSKIGVAWLATILDFGSCLPWNDDALHQLTIDQLMMRLSQTKGYSSERLKKAFELVGKLASITDGVEEDELSLVIGRLSPADDVYSLCKIFQKILYDNIEKEPSNCLFSFEWMDERLEKLILNILEEGANVKKEYNVESFLEWLKKLKEYVDCNETKKTGIPYNTEITYDMSTVQAFSECGSVGSVFKLNIGTEKVDINVNFEPTRTRNRFPAFAGVYYKQSPLADIRDLSKIEFEACAIGEGLNALQVEIKPYQFKWMHEIFPITLEKEFKKYTIYTKDFANPDTLACMEEITFVVTPDHFDDEEMMKGSFAIRNLKIV